MRLRTRVLKMKDDHVGQWMGQRETPTSLSYGSHNEDPKMGSLLT